MKRVLIFFGVLVISCSGLRAQHLKQKGFIGIAPQPMSESVAKYLELKAGTGVIVNSVVPGSSAEKMGVKENDVILKINNQEVKSPQEVIALAGALNAGDKAVIELNRDKKAMKLEGSILPRPTGYGDDVSISLDELPIDKGYTRTVLLRPKNSTGKLPVIYLIQGYPCFSMQYLPPDFPYRTAINAFLKKGYAVYLVEKPGMGDAAGSGTPCSQIGFTKELETFQKGYEKLLTMKDIDPNNIFIFGHSLGGFIAPLVAEKYKPKGVIVYGCGLKSWHDYLVDLVREQAPYQGKDYGDAEEDLKKYRTVLYKYFFEKKTPEQIIAEDPANRQKLVEFLKFDGKDQLVQRHYTFWQELNDYNLAGAWKNTNARVLSIFGEADIAALKATDMQRIAEIVNHYHPGNGTYLFVPKTNHDMVITGTMKENMSIQFSPSYPQYLKNNFNFGLIDMIDNWIKKNQI